MNTLPDFNRIGEIVRSWQQGVLTPEETHEKIERAMDSSNYVPASEMVSMERFSVEFEQNRQILLRLTRVEGKFDAVVERLHASLPPEIDPHHLAEDVLILAKQRKMIEAIKIHRERTGIGLAAAKKIIEDHLRTKPPDESE